MASKFTNLSFYTTARLLSTGTSVTISNDIERDAAVTLTDDANVLFTSLDGGTIERMKVTATGGTLTVVARGLDQTTSPSEVTALKQERKSGTLVKVVQAAWDIVDKDGDNTLSGTNTFSSTTKATMVVQSVTTTQRDALTGVVNGTQIYNTTLGQMQWYEGGAWVANAAGGSVADGSTTVAGKFEEGTVAEQGTATATGGSGARLVVAVANLVKTSSGAGDENKLAVLNASGQFNPGFLSGITKSFTAGENIATDDLVVAESDGSVYKTVRTSSAEAQFNTVTGLQNLTNDRSIQTLYLSDNKAVVLYKKNADNKVYGSVVTFLRTTPTYGAEVEITPALDAAEGFSADVLSSGLIVLGYKLGSDDKMYAIACTISGTTITAGTPVKMYNTNILQASTQVGIAKLTATSFVIMGHDDVTDDAIAVPGTISGTVITAGTGAALEAVTMSASGGCLLCSVSDGVVGAYYDDGTNISFMPVESDGSTITTNSVVDIIAGYIQGGDRAIYMEEGRFLLFRMVNPGFIRVLTINVQDTNSWSAGYFDAVCNYCIPTENDELVRRDIQYLGNNKISLVNTDKGSEDVRIRIFEIGVNNVNMLYDQTITSGTDTHNISLCKLTTNQDKVLMTWKKGNDLYYSLYRNTENKYIGMATETITATNPVVIQENGNFTTTGAVAGTTYYVGNAGARATTGTKIVGVGSSTTNIIMR